MTDGRAWWVYRGQRRVAVGVKYIEILFFLIHLVVYGCAVLSRKQGFLNT